MHWNAEVYRTLDAGRATAGIALLVFSLALGGCVNTATYGTGESPEMTVIKGATGGLTGLGGKKEEIEYKPRAPLVMPPEKNLRPPVVTAAASDPDWPVEAGAAGTEVVDPLGPTSRDNREYRKSLKPINGTLPTDEKPASYDMAKEVDQMHVHAKRDRDARKKFAAALDEAEGLNSAEERRYLTDPPTAYRKPAESAPQEFDDIEKAEGSGFANLFNWFNRSK